MIYNYIPYNSLLERLYSEYSFTKNSGYRDQYLQQMIYDAISLTSNRYILETHDEFLEINDSTTTLPEDLINIVTVALSCHDTLSEAVCHPNEVSPMKWNTDDLSRSYCILPLDYFVDSPNRYTLNKGSIKTNFPEGIIRLVYTRVPIDENGDLMIPSDESFQKYLVNDLAYKIAKDLFFQDRFSFQKLQYIERDRDWYYSQAVTKANMPDKAVKDSWKEHYISTIRDIYPEDSFMSDIADREVRRWHGRAQERPRR